MKVQLFPFTSHYSFANCLADSVPVRIHQRRSPSFFLNSLHRLSPIKWSSWFAEGARQEAHLLCFFLSDYTNHFSFRTLDCNTRFLRHGIIHFHFSLSWLFIFFLDFVQADLWPIFPLGSTDPPNQRRNCRGLPTTVLLPLTTPTFAESLPSPFHLPTWSTCLCLLLLITEATKEKSPLSVR